MKVTINCGKLSKCAVVCGRGSGGGGVVLGGDESAGSERGVTDFSILDRHVWAHGSVVEVTLHNTAPTGRKSGAMNRSRDS